MRSLSAYSRRAFVYSLVPLFVCCAPRRPPASAPEPLVTLEGEIALSGSALDRDIVLSDAGGAICRLAAGGSEHELRSLGGLGVRVTGRLAGRTSGLPEFLVDRYELLPIGGRPAVVGVLEARGGVLRLVDPLPGEACRLDGPLAAALVSFAGYKVWVAGEMRETQGGGARETLLVVESYGVLLPPGSLNRSP